MGSLWQPAGSSSSQAEADLWASLASLNRKLVELNSQMKEINRILYEEIEERRRIHPEDVQ